jgi:import inner membrane translocase subunit TIM44
MVVVKGTKNPWEAMRDRLQDSPFIRDVIRGSRKVTEAASQTDIGKAAVKIGQGVKDKIEDAREFWETSQNPLVYTVAGMVDGLTAETEEGMAIREIKKLGRHHTYRLISSS